VLALFHFAARTHTHARTQTHTHTHACTFTRTRAHAHTHARTHTHARKRSHRVPDADKGLVDFISYLLLVDPRKRPTAAEALQHPFMQYVYE